MRADRSVIETPNKDHVTTEIREHVGRWISTKAGGLEEQQPDEEEVEQDELDADQAVPVQAPEAPA